MASPTPLTSDYRPHRHGHHLRPARRSILGADGVLTETPPRQGIPVTATTGVGNPATLDVIVTGAPVIDPLETGALGSLTRSSCSVADRIPNTIRGCGEMYGRSTVPRSNSSSRGCDVENLRVSVTSRTHKCAQPCVHSPEGNNHRLREQRSTRTHDGAPSLRRPPLPLPGPTTAATDPATPIPDRALSEQTCRR